MYDSGTKYGKHCTPQCELDRPATGHSLSMARFEVGAVETILVPFILPEVEEDNESGNVRLRQLADSRSRRVRIGDCGGRGVKFQFSGRRMGSLDRWLAGRKPLTSQECAWLYQYNLSIRGHHTFVQEF